jgi:hypothetical protein
MSARRITCRSLLAASAGAVGGGVASAACGAHATRRPALELLDGTLIAGALVLIQVRAVSRKGEVVTERTLAETTTESAGRWDLYATPTSEAGRRRMWLRALCPGGPGFDAGVSEPLHVPAGISLAASAANPSVQSTATPVS